MAIAFNYAQVSRRVEDVLRAAFGPNVTIRTDEGWQGRIHVKIVSSAFDGRTEDEKQAMIWDVLRQELGAESQAVSLVLAYGTDEI
jgi:stress-induced morphogen